MSEESVPQSVRRMENALRNMGCEGRDLRSMLDDVRLQPEFDENLVRSCEEADTIHSKIRRGDDIDDEKYERAERAAARAARDLENMSFRGYRFPEESEPSVARPYSSARTYTSQDDAPSCEGEKKITWQDILIGGVAVACWVVVSVISS